MHITVTEIVAGGVSAGLIGVAVLRVSQAVTDSTQAITDTAVAVVKDYYEVRIAALEDAAALHAKQISALTGNSDALAPGK